MSDEPEQPGHALTARFARFAEYDPDEADGDTLTWYVRGTNVLVAYTEADTGAVLASRDQRDEYVVLLPDAWGTAVVRAADESVDVPGASLAVVPPGPSEIRLDGRVAVVRLFPTSSRQEEDRGAGAGPEPAEDGDLGDPSRVRRHDLGAPPEPGCAVRVWRSPKLLVACPEPVRGPEDATSVVPRCHPEAERYALVLRGAFVHHVRWPETGGSGEDEHERCAAPSLAIIPPGRPNASQAVGPGLNELVEVYCPPPAGCPWEPDQRGSPGSGSRPA